MERIDEELEADAWAWLRVHDERPYSFVDATSFSLMRRSRLTDALAFDGGSAAAGVNELRPSSCARSRSSPVPVPCRAMRKGKKKRWSELSPKTRTAIVAAGLAEVVVTGIALRDLLRRPAVLVRGPKLLWGPLLFVQPIGSPLYLIAGRRPAQT